MLGSLTVVTPMLLGMDFLDASYWLDLLGPALFWVGLVVVFVECGLLFPFLPGDTLLFSFGIFVSAGHFDLFPGTEAVEVVLAAALLSLSAFLGNVAGYEIGRRIGPPLYQRDSRFLSRTQFDRTQQFFDDHGPVALVGGRFIAFVRTYITVVAGATQMRRRVFLVWSAVGATLWVSAVTLLGYFLGGIPWLGENLDVLMILVMAVFFVPMLVQWLRERRRTDGEQADEAAQPAGQQTTPAQAVAPRRRLARCSR
ncbi:DedA family protein [Nocardioides bruguierae]|uniref:DedA family protein n=1 Tax=Nocardioides bruguierae TaxID=2945102 RepID=A0A9X2D6Q2_9ACTN|nr:DedA family protein [Nocardioides bruguierae]MCM0620382.1 DedA family protein [Nocardioides bruguierae]